MDDKLKIDGKLNEASWQNSKWSDKFADIEGNLKPLPSLDTRFKLLWDDQYLYIAAELEETGIWGYFTKYDDVVYNENDFEIFIDPDGDAANYFEIEVNALKNIFDLFLGKPYRNGGKALISWNAKGMKVGVRVEGTVNKPGDKDKKWTVEMAVPFSALSYGDNVQVPQNNTIWRMNFSRVEWDTEIIDGKYVKKKDSITGRNLPEHNWVWSPQGIINMHCPERWGYVQFAAGAITAEAEPVILPESEELKKMLWLVYYKEYDYFKVNKKFTGMLSELNFSNAAFKIGGQSYNVTVVAVDNLFQASISAIDGKIFWRITQDGEIKKIQ